MQSPLIIALDYAKLDDALAIADLLDPATCRVKVGKELFTAEGPLVLRALRNRGFEVFLDLKFHDIPNTVAKAVLAAADQGVWMVNVHASGGRRMMEAAADILEKHSMKTLLTAVTVLTSLAGSELAEVGITSTIDEQVERLAQLAQASGLDGVVCSAREARRVRQCCGDDFLKVTPGIRPWFAAANDQQRITTPAQALDDGSTHLVIGRPVTQADDPSKALAEVLREIEGH
ncbi:orotidine-5'-phosphate decarboxylase [Halotalea alkalilenta]|uniref:Orotidine 5'-phosphate decarboxylase n=1 Tax=Halotalea alkalilenta TaxID=376489 RepID=A0A172YE75_9GAMM|nr:orotidine-5'-phosphate decarboxylase [Halotalea alkalilenta]ANF57571.1 orotidine 5'-phosphate decarboxylase [Halotalea alkalilenta]